MEQTLDILNVFNALTLKQVFWKKKTLLEKLEYYFLVEVLLLKAQQFHTKLSCKKSMLR